MNSTCMIYWGRPSPGSCSWIWPWSGVDRHWNQGQSDPELAVIWVSTSIWTGLDSTLYSRSALNQGHIWSRSSHYLRAGSQFEPRPSHGMAQHTTPSWKDMVDLQSSHKAEGIMSLFKKMHSSNLPLPARSMMMMIIILSGCVMLPTKLCWHCRLLKPSHFNTSKVLCYAPQEQKDPQEVCNYRESVGW